jgi:hypothetical protein
VEQFVRGAATLPLDMQIAIGGPLPEDAQLDPLPDEVRNQIAGANKYRYTVWHDQVLLVDPHSKTVAGHPARLRAARLLSRTPAELRRSFQLVLDSTLDGVGEYLSIIRHGGLHDATGSACRDDCDRIRSGESIAAG